MKKNKKQTKEFGTALREERMAKNLTQKELADLVGIAPKYLSRIELGEQEPSVFIAASLAKALGTSLDGLLDLPAQPPPSEVHIHMTMKSRKELRRLIEMLNKLLA